MRWLFGKNRSSNTGWLRSKRLKVQGPTFWGKFEIFVDQDLHVAIFLPKMDRSIHVLIGTISEATLHLTFNASGKRTQTLALHSDEIQWRLNPADIQFLGRRLPPGEKQYTAEILTVGAFSDLVDQAWIVRHVQHLHVGMDIPAARTDTAPAQTDAHQMHADVPTAPMEPLEAFEHAIRRHEDHVFGLRLLSSSLKIQFADQPEIGKVMLDTYQHIKERQTDALAEAKTLILQVRKDVARTEELTRFSFPPLQGNPGLDDIAEQVQVYVKTFNRLFPKRNRGAFLSATDRQHLHSEVQKSLQVQQTAIPIVESKPKPKAKPSHLGTKLDTHF